MHIHQVIIEPLLTEKSNIMRDKHRYTFRVDPAANKHEVMKAIQAQFSVHPLACRIMNVKGKPKQQGRSRRGARSNWKKAIITLPATEKIDIFEGV